jgi:hypothetical protein
MANNNLQKYFRMKPEVSQIFDDLEVYHQFCRDYGYVYDEKHLYNERSPYNEFLKMKKGREPWDQWRSPRRERNFNRPYNNGHHNNNYNRNDRG